MEMRGKILRMGDEWCVCARQAVACCWMYIRLTRGAREMYIG